MVVATHRLQKLCRRKGITLSVLLQRAGVSRNAYYSLARKDSILPKSLTAIASELGVAPHSLLRTREGRPSMVEVVAELDEIMREHPEADRDNVRHTLLLLRKKPIDRLRRALLRGQATHTY